MEKLLQKIINQSKLFKILMFRKKVKKYLQLKYLIPQKLSNKEFHLKIQFIKLIDKNLALLIIYIKIRN